MAKRTVQLTLEKIEEGRLLENINSEISDATKALIAHVRAHGPEATAKATAEITIKIKIQKDGVEPTDYSIKGTIASKRPGRPSNVTRAMHEEDIEGDGLMLFVNIAGSTKDHPRQGRFATADGKLIDAETGAARPVPAAKSPRLPRAGAAGGTDESDAAGA